MITNLFKIFPICILFTYYDSNLIEAQVMKIIVHYTKRRKVTDILDIRSQEAAKLHWSAQAPLPFIRKGKSLSKGHFFEDSNIGKGKFSFCVRIVMQIFVTQSLLFLNNLRIIKNPQSATEANSCFTLNSRH